jgi:hypothetical protein
MQRRNAGINIHLNKSHLLEGLIHLNLEGLILMQVLVTLPAQIKTTSCPLTHAVTR